MVAVDNVIIEDTAKAVREFDQEAELAFDIETNSLNAWAPNAKIAVITLATRDGRVAVLHLRGQVPPYLWRFLEDRELLIGHNVVNFDSVWCAVHGMDIERTKWFDTMVAEQSVLPAGRKDYRASLAKTLERRFKDDNTARKKQGIAHTWMDEELSDEQVEYAAHDVLHIHELRDRQLEKAMAGGSLIQALQLEMDILPAITRMQINGLPISLPKVYALLAQKRALAEPLEEQICTELGRKINLNSAVQLKQACWDAGLRIPDTTADTFKELALQSSMDSLAGRIIQWKLNAQIMKMFREEWVSKHVQRDGRVHGSFWQLGTDTGRLSSTNPNLQQQPKEARFVYEAPEGYMIVSCDYSQIEVRIAAAQAHDEVMLSSMDQDDVHRAVAAQMFDLPPDQISKEQRFIAKACVFTLLFAGSAERLYEYTHINGGSLSLEDSRILFAKFFATYGGLRQVRYNAQALSRRQALPITLPSGLKRILIRGDSLTPQTIINTMVQGAAAAGLKYALKLCIERGLHRYLCATVHDELVAVVPEEMAEQYGKDLEAAMLDGMRVVTDAPLRAEVKIGRMWQ